jgi:hypothetical protein
MFIYLNLYARAYERNEDRALDVVQLFDPFRD